MLKDFKRITTVVKITGNKTFVSNPINVFILVKSLLVDLQEMASPTYLQTIKFPEGKVHSKDCIKIKTRIF